MTHITGTLQNIDPVLNLKKRMLFWLMGNNEVTIKSELRGKIHRAISVKVLPVFTAHIILMLHSVSASLHLI